MYNDRFIMYYKILYYLNHNVICIINITQIFLTKQKILYNIQYIYDIYNIEADKQSLLAK